MHLLVKPPQHLLLNLQKKVTTGTRLRLLWREGLLIRFPLPRLAVEWFWCQKWHRSVKESTRTSDQTLSLFFHHLIFFFFVFCKSAFSSLVLGPLIIEVMGYCLVSWVFVLLLFLQAVSGVVCSELRDFRKLWSSKSAVSGAHMLRYLQGIYIFISSLFLLPHSHMIIFFIFPLDVECIWKLID